MGFDESEVADNIETVQPDLANDFFGRQRRPAPSTTIVLDVPAADVMEIEQAAPSKLQVTPDAAGKAKLKVTGFLRPVEKERALEKLLERLHGAFQDAMKVFERENFHLASPAQRGEPFIVPRLFAAVQGELLLADTDVLFEHHDWTLKDHEHRLTERDFSIRPVAAPT